MAEIDELLANAEEIDYLADGIQFLIDENLRTVTIPSDGVVLGVEGDKNSNRVNFQMPRYYNGFDMSEFTVRVNYVNANGDPGVYTVKDLEVRDDMILFTWLVDSDACAYVGVVRFLVRMTITNGSELIQAFDTTIAKANVLEGLPITNIVDEEDRYDIVLHLMGEVDEYIEKRVGNIDALEMVGQSTEGVEYEEGQIGQNGAEIFNDYENNVAIGSYSHAEGYHTTASANQSHAEGNFSTASGTISHAEGYKTTSSGNASHAEGNQTTASEEAAHSEGTSTTASGNSSHAEGGETTASGNYAHAEGHQTTAFGVVSHAEGEDCYAEGNMSHAEGWGSSTTGAGSHAEGFQSVASGNYSHAEGYEAKAENIASHAEGMNTTASKEYSHAEGSSTVASGWASHAEGENATASGQDAHAEGYYTTASGQQSHAEGYYSKATNAYSHAEGYKTESKGYASHAEGYKTIAANVQGQHAMGSYNIEDTAGKYAFIIGNGDADDNRSNALAIDWDGKIYVGDATEGVDVSTLGGSGGVGQNTEGKTYEDFELDGLKYDYEGKITAEVFNDYTNNIAAGDCSHAEGTYTAAIGDYSHAEGGETTAKGTGSHSEGLYTIAKGSYSHAEGQNTKANNTASHAEGQNAAASGIASHAEGYETKATGKYSHAEGQSTTASAQNTHAEGQSTEASKSCAHAEGWNTVASAYQAHAEGASTIAASENQHVQGKFNVEDTTGKYAFIIGNGTSSVRSNAFAIDWDGKIYVDNATEGVNVSAFGSSISSLTTEVSTLTNSVSAINSGMVGKRTEAEGAEVFNDYSNNEATGEYSHASGYRTAASSAYQTVIGQLNNRDTEGKYAFIIGNGYMDQIDTNAYAERRSTGFAIDWDGKIYVNGSDTGVDVSVIPSLIARIEALEAANGS